MLSDADKRKAMEQLQTLLSGALEARGRVLLKLNVDAANLEAVIAREDIDEQLDDLLVVIDDKNALLAAFEQLGGDVVGLHEPQQLDTGNAPEARARHTEAVEPAVVEAPDDGVLADLADLGGLAGGEHLLVGPG